jgi:hypothetical protein
MHDGRATEPHTAAFLGALEERAAALREAFIELRANG